MNMRAAGIPTPPKMEIFQGTTDVNGNWTVVFPTPYSATPHINPVMYPVVDTQMMCLLTAASTTGFTVQVRTRSMLSVLSVDLLSFASTPVNGANVRAFVTNNQ